MDRRRFVSTVATSAAAWTGLRCNSVLGQASRPKRVLLRSSWQTVNIGDIAHTPGVLRLLEQHLPEVDVWLWPSNVDNGVRELLLARFPKLKIVEGKTAQAEAMDACDFLLHGSGPSLVAENDVQAWRTKTGKPYGVYGITLPQQPSSATRPIAQDKFQRTIELLSGAQFVFFRDGVSLELAKQQGCRAPTMEFGPDGAFANDLRDEDAAERFLASQQLKPGEFFCCIPRLRYTPYWTIPEKHAAFDEVKHARNEEMKEHDLAPLRQAIVEVTRQTPHRVLICPEDQTQMAVGKEMLFDRLPDDVRARTAWRPNYWLTGEAASTYKRSLGLFGTEMHSPIMCIGMGIPALVARWAEQTSKGFMWRDIGLADWLFDFDQQADLQRFVPTVLAMAQNRPQAQQRTDAARAVVERRQHETMQVLRTCLGL